MDKIAVVVSAQLLNHRLNFEETLKPYFEDVKSHTDTKTKEVMDHVSTQTNEIKAEISNVTHEFKNHVSNVATANKNEIISKLQPLIETNTRPNLGIVFFYIRKKCLDQYR